MAKRVVSREQDRRICAAMPSPKKQAKEFDRSTRRGMSDAESDASDRDAEAVQARVDRKIARRKGRG